MFIHAAGESSPGDLPDGVYAIALHADDMAHLFRVACVLARNHIKHKLIIESDAPYEGQLMAIGIAPMEREKIRPLLADLKSAK
jgi:hypothetical protein